MVQDNKPKQNVKIALFDEYTGDIKYETDAENLTSQLIYKMESQRKYQLKRTNSILVGQYGEKMNVFQYAMVNAAKNLRTEELKVFIYLLSLCDFENWIQVTQPDIGKELNMLVPNVSRAIKGIKEKKFLFIIKKGSSNYYRINPEIGWKGSFESWKKVLEFPDRYTTDTPK